MTAEPNDPEETLARISQELQHLREGLRLLGLRPCSHCGRYFLSSDAGALLDAGQLVCYICLHDWWQQRSPALSVQQRQTAEHKILRWLVAYHGAKVVNRPDKMPPAEEIEFKLVVACDECDGTGKNDAGGKCHNCGAQGSVWVVRLTPQLL